MENITKAICFLLIRSEMEELNISSENLNDFKSMTNIESSFTTGALSHLFNIRLTTEDIKKMLAANILILDPISYFYDEFEELKIADYDEETQCYYYNGYELDTNEYPILNHYLIDSRFSEGAKSILHSIPESLLSKTGYFYINNEMYKFRPIVAQLYQALEEKPDNIQKALTTCYDKYKTIELIKQYAKYSSMVNLFSEKDGVKKDENEWLTTLNIK